MITEFGMNRTSMYLILTVAEMVIFKILYLYKYSRIAVMNEYFLTHFTILFNLVIIFGFTIIRISLEENMRTRLYFFLFGKPYEVYKKVNFP